MRIGKMDIPLSPKGWWREWREDYKGFSWWRRGLFRLAVLALIGGIAIRTLFGGWDETFASMGNEPASEVPRTALLEPATPAATAAEPEGSEVWSSVSGLLMKCGLSFMLAFVIAYLLRKAIKTGIILLLAVAALLLTLNGLGIIDLPFESWSEDLKALAGSLEGKSREFLALIKGWLPSSVTSGAGLFAGFRKS